MLFEHKTEKMYTQARKAPAVCMEKHGERAQRALDVQPMPGVTSAGSHRPLSELRVSRSARVRNAKGAGGTEPGANTTRERPIICSWTREQQGLRYDVASPMRSAGWRADCLMACSIARSLS
jgi:hypothetical protein